MDTTTPQYQLMLKRHKQYRKNLRIQVLDAYGKRCACCGEDELPFLSLDHINGGGTKERKKYDGQYQMWRQLRRDGWPSGYQVLCHNCNLAKGFYGSCPHKTKEFEDSKEK